MLRRALPIALVAAVSMVAASCGAADADEADAVRAAITDAITSQQNRVTVTDPRTNDPIQLEFDHVHEGWRRLPEVGRSPAWTSVRRMAPSTTLTTM